METKVLQPNKDSLELCKELILSGEVVAIPTETVYGLGANAFNEDAVAKIYEAKGRPSDNPLIVHIADKTDVARVAREIPPLAQRVIDKFMPGSVTIVLPKQKTVPDRVTGGLDTVAVRMPAHEVALEFIRTCGVPICAPSANTSTKPSPTTATHVFDDLNGKIPAILDGGDCGVGVESTVIDFVTGKPRLLRAGGMPLEVLEREIGEIVREVKSAKPLCPGMKYKHYSPDASVTVFLPGNGKTERIISRYDEFASQGKKVIILALDDNAPKYGDRMVFSMGVDDKSYAKRLFSALRDADKKGYDAVLCEGLPERGYGLSVMNRLLKAAAGKVE